MADLGAVGRDVLAMDRRRILPEWPISRARDFVVPSTLGLMELVDAPVAASGTRSLQARTPGIWTFERPVDPGTLTVRVDCRQTADVIASGRVGLGGPEQSWRARLAIEREDGVLAVASMTDAIDTWVLLEATLPIVRQGVVRIHLDAGLGVLGDNTLFLSESARRSLGGPRVWFNNLRVAS